MTLQEGDILDNKYWIVRVLGCGGMGVVYIAENTRVRRQVAIKVLRQEAVAAAGDALLRFEREAQAAGKIGSDHIVEVLDLGTTEGGDRFMVMELLEGETLKQRVSRGRLHQEKIVAIFRQLLDGLAAAHAAGIVHRDLKPDNVFLQKEKAGQRDWVKILDFGISKFSAMTGDQAQSTQVGTVLGTPYYMSPEQARSASAVDARSDLYTVAVMLYELLTGQVPYHAPTFAELMFKIIFEPQPHPKAVMPTLDDELCAIIVKGMSRDPAARFQTAAELQAALAAWESRLPGAAPSAEQLPRNTQDGWEKSGADRPAGVPPKRSLGVLFAVLGALLLGGAAAALVALRGQPRDLTAVARPLATNTSAAASPPVSAAAVPEASSAPAETSSPAAPEPTSRAAVTSAPSAPSGRPASKKPSQVVKDYGY